MIAFLCILFLMKIRFPARKSIAETISKRYGINGLRSFRRFERLGQRAAKAKEDWNFLQQCIDNRILPKFLNFKTANGQLRSNAGYRLSQQHLLNAELANKRRQAQKLGCDERAAKTALQSSVGHLDFLCLVNFARRRRAAEIRNIRSRHANKLNNLLQSSRNGLLNPDSVVVNLTDIRLDYATKSALSKGLRLAIPAKLRRAEYLCGFEKTFRQLQRLRPMDDTNGTAERFKSTFQHEAMATLYGYDPSRIRSPLSKAEAEALKNLSRRDDVVVMKPDKGNGAVLMYRQDYKRKLKEILNGPQFKQITADPLKIILAAERKLNGFLKKLLKKEAISEAAYQEMRATGSTPGILYGLPKIHKTAVPVRPILSSIGTYNYNVCKFLVPLLEPLTRGLYTTRDTFHFVNEICDRRDADTVIMASLDVESLFTNIPAKEAVDICTAGLYTAPNESKLGKSDFAQLLQFAMESNYCKFDGAMYQQTDGVSMGSPISPAIANAFLVHHERQRLDDCPVDIKPVFYRRYVDDTFLLFRRADHLPLFLDFMNSRHPNIKFTAEMENNGQLPFLDVLVQREGQRFSTTVHRKKTATNQLLHFDTLLPTQYKTNLVACLVRRAYNICSSYAKFDDVITQLKSTFGQNGFPANVTDFVVRRTLRNLRKPADKQPTAAPKPIHLTVPFLGLRSMQMKKKLLRICGLRYPQAQLRVVFKPMLRVHQLFAYKDKIPTMLRSSVVYHYQCGSCNAAYVGETTRHLGIRASEHIGISATTQKKIRDPTTSAIFDHATRLGHRCSIENFRVLASGTSDFDLRIKESLLIQELKPQLNENVSSTELLLF